MSAHKSAVEMAREARRHLDHAITLRCRRDYAGAAEAARSAEVACAALAFRHDQEHAGARDYAAGGGIP